MIRIFITTLIYLISLLTQAQEVSDKQHIMLNQKSIEGGRLTHAKNSNDTANFEATMFSQAEFELKDKDLTFEIKI